MKYFKHVDVKWNYWMAHDEKDVFFVFSDTRFIRAWTFKVNHVKRYVQEKQWKQVRGPRPKQDPFDQWVKQVRRKNAKSKRKK